MKEMPKGGSSVEGVLKIADTKVKETTNPRQKSEPREPTGGQVNEVCVCVDPDGLSSMPGPTSLKINRLSPYLHRSAMKVHTHKYTRAHAHTHTDTD